MVLTCCNLVYNNVYNSVVGSVVKLITAVFIVYSCVKHFSDLRSLPDGLLASSLSLCSASSETDMVRFGSGIDNFQTCQKIASELEIIPVLVYHKLSQRTPANGSHTERRLYIIHSECLLCVSE